MFVLIKFEDQHIPILYDLEHEYIDREETLNILDLISCRVSTTVANVKFSEIEQYANKLYRLGVKAKTFRFLM